MTPKRARYAQTGFLALYPKAWAVERDAPRRPQDPFETIGSLAVIDVDGELLAHEDPWGCWDSYEGVSARARAAFDSPARTVAMRINSPGGEAAGCLELARELRAMSESSGKPLVAYVDGCAASAAYAIASAAQRIFAPPTSSVGSIGVFEAMVDVTAMDRMMGVTMTFVASGARKLDGNPHVPLTEDARAAKQAKVDLLAGLFFDLVGEMRAIGAEGVKALEGELLLSAQALGAGIIDGVTVWPALLETLESESYQAPAAARETTPIGSRTSMAKASDDEWKALRTLSESDDPEKQKMAKKMLATMVGDAGEGGGGDGESEEDKKKKDEEAKAKAKSDEDAKAKAESEKDEKAKALAANNLAMATEIATLKAKDAARDAADAKAKSDAALADLFAKRPDLTEGQRKALSLVPVEQAKALVDTWPRVAADPAAAAAAMLAQGSGGERTKGDYRPQLTAEQTAILARLEQSSEPVKAFSQGTSFFTPYMTPEQAKARLAELDKEEAV